MGMIGAVSQPRIDQAARRAGAWDAKRAAMFLQHCDRCRTDSQEAARSLLEADESILARDRLTQCG